MREDEVYMQLLNQNILYISRLRVQKDSIIRRFNRLCYLKDGKFYFYCVRVRLLGCGIERLGCELHERQCCRRLLRGSDAWLSLRQHGWYWALVSERGC